MKLPRFDKAHVLVIGDLMLDRYWLGTTERVSAEAPIPIVSVKDIEDRPGAAANVALNVASLGANVALIGMVGRDEPGELLLEKLDSAGVSCRLYKQSGYRTTTKLRIVSRNQQLIRADFELCEAMDERVLAKLIDETISNSDNVLLSDYDKGVIVDPQKIIAQARLHKKPVMVDPKFKNFEAYRGATIIKPNMLELSNAIGQWDTEAEMTHRCSQLMYDISVDAILVTRSSEGMTLLEKTGNVTHYPARTREVYDVSGAGDTVIATVCSALGAGHTLKDSVGLANIAAGLVVGHFGITSVSGPELGQAVAGDLDFDRGVMSQEQVIKVVEEAKLRQEKIVMTNGCFDLLHAGHVNYLKEARSLGDRLIVAVNNDDSVSRQKGEGRPLVSLDHRMTTLAGLTDVDWVISFDEDTPEDLISLIQPDILVKGGDYSVDQVVGGEIVEAYNGEVRVVSLIEDCSTSALVEKIRKM